MENMLVDGVGVEGVDGVGPAPGDARGEQPARLCVVQLEDAVRQQIALAASQVR